MAILADAAKQISLVVCTVDRFAGLERCLASVESFRSVLREVIVVNNGPHLAAVQEIAARHYARMITEPRRGSGSARNAGIRAATGRFIAFLDDDTQADENWLPCLMAPFSDAAVDGVLGTVRASNSVDPIHKAFQQFAVAPLPSVPTTLDARAAGDPFPLRMAMNGFTMNAVFRREVFDLYGYFDRRFGPGTRVRYGDDTEFFFRVLLHGGRIQFEPRAVVAHRWPIDPKGWRRGVFGAACGHTALLTKYFFAEPGLRGEVRRYLQNRWRNRHQQGASSPGSVELPGVSFILGSLYGPIAFLLSGKP